MANVQPLFLDTTTGRNKRFSDSDIGLLGGIDLGAAGTLLLGNTTATAVTIGSATAPVTVGGNLIVNGTETIIGGVTFQGDTTFGDAITDTVEFVARIKGSTDLLPIVDSSCNAGSDALRFLGMFGDKITTEEIEDTLGSLIIDSINAAAPSTVTIQNSDATYTVELTVQGDVTVDETLNVTGVSTLSGGLAVDGGTVDIDVTSDFSANVVLSGTATLTVADAVIFNGNVTLGSDAGDNINLNGDINTSITFQTDGASDIGTTGVRAGHIYCDNLTVTAGITATQANRIENDYVAAAGGITDRDVVYKNSTNNEVGKAQGNSVATSKVIGIAMATIGAASSGAICSQGVITGVGSGWTAGTLVWLSTSVAGGTQTTIPTGTGNVALPLGYAKNATDLDLQIGMPTLL